MGQSYRIDSENPVTLSLWLYEIALKVMSGNTAMQYIRLSVWPRTTAENAMIGRNGHPHITAAGMRELMKGLAEWQFWLEAEEQR